MDFENFDLNIIETDPGANHLFNRHYLAYSKDKNNPQIYEIIESDHSMDQIGTLISWGTMLMQLSHQCLIIPQIEKFPNQNQRKLIFKHEPGIKLVDYLNSPIKPSAFDLLYIFYILAHDLRLMHLKGLAYGGWKEDSIYLSVEELNFSYIDHRSYLVNEPTNKPIRILVPKIKHLKPYPVDKFEYQKSRDTRKLTLALYIAFVSYEPEMPSMTEQKKQMCREKWHQFKKYANDQKIDTSIVDYLKDVLIHGKNMDQLCQDLHDLLKLSFASHFTELEQALQKRLAFRNIYSQYTKLKRTLVILTAYVDRWFSSHNDQMSLCDEQMHQLYEVLKETQVLKNKIEILSQQELPNHHLSLQQIKVYDEIVHRSSHVANRINSRPPLPQILEDFPGTFLREMNSNWGSKAENDQDHLFDDLRIFHPNWNAFENKVKKNDPNFSLNELSIVLTQTPLPQTNASISSLNALPLNTPMSKPPQAHLSNKPISNAPISADISSLPLRQKSVSASIPIPKVESENDDLKNQPAETTFHPTLMIDEVMPPGQTSFFTAVDEPKQIHSVYHTNPEVVLKQESSWLYKVIAFGSVILLFYFFGDEIKEKLSIIIDYYKQALQDKVNKH